jgi:hypothetical protein
MSEYAKLASVIGGENFRYKAENILCLDLDLPSRTTLDYEGPAVEPRIQAAITSAMTEEQDDLTLQSQ